MGLDAFGNVYLAGPTFVAKYQSNGAAQVTQIWSQSLVGNVQPSSILVSPTGRVHVVGLYRGTVNADNDLDLELDSERPNYSRLCLFWLIYGQI